MRKAWASVITRILLVASFGFAFFAGMAHAANPTALYNTCLNLRSGKHAVQGCARKEIDGSWVVVEPSNDLRESRECAASGTYVDSAGTVSNFGKLRIVTSSVYSDLDQAFGAGFLEGYLTAERIYDHHYNLKQYFVVMLNESESLELAINWLERQQDWANGRVRSAPPEDPYWRLLGLVQAQFDGLVAGYQARAHQEQQRRQQTQWGGLSRRLGGVSAGGDADVAAAVSVGWLERRDLMFLNSNGDVYDIIDALEAGFGGEVEEEEIATLHQRDPAQVVGSTNDSGREAVRSRRNPRSADVDPDPLRMSLKLGLQGKCSALIKVTGDLGDLLLGHSTHDSFTAMTRIYKHYDFSALSSDLQVAAPRMSFSSYPGELFSDDDFYLLSSGLAVMETTNHIYVGSVYSPGLSPACVLSWQRLRLSLWLANSGEEWVEIFSRYNSGTYNNQYMIVDTKRFIPHVELQPGLLWVVEQLPGLFKSADVTSELSRGYWPSYNVAYFPEVYSAAGYPDMIERLSQEGAEKYAFSIRLLKYQIAPRAAIFRRDQGQVDNLDHLKRIMRYNDWKKDPYADGNPVGAVCARGDLAKGGEALAKGCYDSKVTSARLIADMASEVVGGPTAEEQPPFSWSDPRWSKLPHRGMPDTFDFSFERMSPQDLPTFEECAIAEAAAARANLKQHQEQKMGGIF